MDAELTDPLGRLSPLYDLGTELTIRPRGGGTGSNIKDSDIAETLANRPNLFGTTQEQTIDDAVKTARGIRAYHGSPHEFEKFDTSKIGTGEGAQAYGHGLYFAESEPIARDYRDRLTDLKSTYQVGNYDMPKWVLRKLEDSADRAEMIKNLKNNFNNTIQENLKEKETSPQPWLSDQRISYAKDILAGLEHLEKGEKIPHTRGRMYEVNINAHPDHFLDWDKPLSEQSDYVKNIIGNKSIFSGDRALGEILGRAYRNELFGGDVAKTDRAKPHEVSSALSNMGVKGIKYFDANSRSKGEGTSNYVVFDPNDIEIMRRYARGGDVTAMQEVGRTGYAGKGAVREDDDVRSALDIARQYEDPANRIEADIRALTQNLSGLDISSAFPAFHTGLPQRPQVGGAGLVPPRPSNESVAKTIALEELARAAGMTPREYGERFTSLKKPATPFEEWQYTQQQNAALKPRKVFDPNEMKVGDVIIPFVGDLTSAGQKVTNINQRQLAKPLLTEGGESYMRSTPDIWASGQSIISALNNRAQRAIEIAKAMGNKEPTAYGFHVGMDPMAGDFSTHTAEGILGLLPTAKIKASDAKKFDQFMKNPTSEFKGFKDWPGLKSEKLQDYLMEQGKGAARIKFSKGMDKAEWRDLGFPDVGPARFASTETLLGGLPTGATGTSIGRLALENAVSKAPESIHRSYPVSLRGEYVGGLSIPLQRDLIFKDWSDRFDANPPARNFISAKNKSYANKDAYQIVTNRWLDTISKALEEANRNRAEGGRTMGNNAIDNAIRVARLSDDKIDMPQSLKELQNWKKTHPSRNSIDRAFSARVSGFEGAPPVAMPANIDELLAYLRGQHASGGRAAFGFGGDSDAAEGSSYTDNITHDTPSFREAEDRSMRDYESYQRDRNEGRSSYDRDSGGREFNNDSRDRSYDRSAEGLNAQRAMQDVNPFSFGRRDIAYGQNFVDQAPSDLQQYTTQRLNTVPENIYQAASNPSFYLGMGKPGLVGMDMPTRAGLAGFMGNLAAESEFDPTAINPSGGATGLAQWTGTRKAGLLENLGISPKTSGEQLRQALEGTQYNQLGYALNELQNDPYYAASLKQFTKGTDPARAAEVFMKNFEAPSQEEQQSSFPRRSSEAEGFYKRAEANLPANVYSGTRYASNLRPNPMETMTDATRDTGKVEMLPSTDQATTATTQSKEIPLLINASLTPALNRARIAELEGKGMTELGREYELTDANGNVISPKEWYRQDMERQLGRDVSMDEVKSGLVMRDGQQVVNYALKDPETELFKAIMPGSGLAAALGRAFGTDASKSPQAQNYGPYGNLTAQEYRQQYGGNDTRQQQASAQPPAAAPPAPYKTELSQSNLDLPTTEGLTAEQWAAKYAGGDMSKVHARIVYRDGAPRLEYYTPSQQTAVA